METSFANGGQLSRIERRSLDPLGHYLQGAEVDAQFRCALVGEPKAKLAQTVVDGRIHGQHPDYEKNTIATAKNGD